MNKIYDLLLDITDKNTLIKLIFGNPRKKSNPCKKVTVRPFLNQGALQYQFEYIVDNKASHENTDIKAFLKKAMKLIEDDFKQVNIFSEESDYQILATKPDNPKIIKSPPTKTLKTLEHNRAKEYIIPDETHCDFLIALGVMDKSGKVFQKHYAKFRQINRFLEIVSDVAEKIPSNGKIIDFGCGKAYLTFALYYYLNIKLSKNVEIIGLDLKSDVIDFCTNTATQLDYSKLSFQLGDIVEFDSVDNADMVVTLHACDTATDFALIKAVGWNASVILSVPCCQHELFSMLNDEIHSQIFSHGILKERFSAILTDGLRSLKLQSKGYEVDLIEFTSLEHTSKNIMIRALKCDKNNDYALKSYEALKEYWHVNPTIDNL